MAERSQRRLAAILAADVAGYSRLVGVDEEGTLEALRAHRLEVIEPILRDHGGRIANTAGDSFLIEFASAVDAVRFAIAMQEGLGSRNEDVPDDRRIRFRIGINVGDVIIEGDDLLGHGVNVAARIEALAAPGGIALSEDAYRQIAGRVDATWTDIGMRSLKNIADLVRVWTLRLDGDERSDTAASLAVASPERSSQASIAVLPFDNMSGDSEQGYFADGITEDLITEIARIPELFVISRNSTFTYKGKSTKVQDVCRDLDVRYVLEGSVRRSGQRIRVTAQLVDGSSGGHVWAERYDRELADIFAVQDDVTAQIVRALELKLVATNRAGTAHIDTSEPEAYDCVLRAREHYRLFTTEDNAAARALYERAIGLDPDYAEPYAGLAETYVQDWLMGSEPTLDRAFQLAKSAATRDPTLPLVQEALSTVRTFRKEHDEAIAAARHWIDLEPSNADAYATLAGAMHFSGRNEEVIPLVETAMRLNPFYPFFYPHYIGLAKVGTNHFDEAVVAFEQALDRNSEALWPHLFLAVCYGHLGKETEARVHVTEMQRVHPSFSVETLFKLLPYKSAAELDLVVDGLRKAGLPT
ncbi:MAG: adenylate/guanylate cyclase domain-containing protein [Pseudomonadota bacterium]